MKKKSNKKGRENAAYTLDNFPMINWISSFSSRSHTQILSAVQIIVIARPEPPRRLTQNTPLPFLRQVQQPRNSYGAPTEPYGELLWSWWTTLIVIIVFSPQRSAIIASLILRSTAQADRNHQKRLRPFTARWARRWRSTSSHWCSTAKEALQIDFH